MSDLTQKLLNRETGTLEDIPLSALSGAITSGKYLAKPDQRFRMYNDVGKLGEVEAGNVSKALQRGYRFVGEEEIQSADREAKYGTAGQKAIGYAESAASGLTLGASRQIEKALGVESEGMAGREEAIGLGGDITEGVAMVAPMLFTGGAGAAVKGGATAAKVGLGGKLLGGIKAVSVPRHLATGARAAEKALLGAGIKGAAKKGLLEHAAAKALVGAGEFGVYGAGHELSRAALEDREITAESIMSNVTPAALLGAGLMGGGSLAFGVGKKAFSGAYGKFADQVEKNQKKIQELLAKKTPEAQAQAAKLMTETEGLLGKAGDKFDKYLKDTGEKIGQTEMAKGQGQAQTLDEFLATVTRGEAKPEAVRRGIGIIKGEGKEAFHARAKTDLAIDQIGTDAVAAYGKVKNELIPELSARRYAILEESTAKIDAKKIKDALWKNFDEIDAKAFSQNKGKNITKGVREELEKDFLVPVFNKKGVETGVKVGKMNAKQFQGMTEFLQERIGGLSKSTEMALYGPRKIVNEAMKKAVKASNKALGKEIEGVLGRMTKMYDEVINPGDALLFKKIKGEKYVRDGVIDEVAGKALNYLERPNMPVSDSWKKLIKGLDTHAGSRIEGNVMDRIAYDATIGVPSESLAELTAMAVKASAGAATHHTLAMRTQMMKMYRWMLDQTVGRARAGLFEESSAVKTAASKLGEIYNMVKKDKGRMADSAKAFIGKGKDKLGGMGKMTMPKSPRILPPVMTKALMEFNLGGNDNPKDDREALINIRNDVNSIMSDPNKRAMAISGSDTISRVDPELDSKVSALKDKLLGIIVDGLPGGQDRYEEINGGTWQPSDVDVNDAKQMIAVIQDPTVVLDAMNAGTLTPKMAKVFKEAYPRKYEDLKLEIIRNLAGSKLEYAKRGMMMFLFDSTLDKSYERDTLNRIQGNFFNEPTEGDIAGGRTGKVRAKGADKLTYGEDSATTMQRIEGGLQ